MDVPELLTRRQLLEAGYSDAELGCRRRRGELTVVRRGFYARCAPTADSCPSERACRRHVMDARAACALLAEGTVASHVTAAVLHGLPVWRIPLARVHATRPRRSSGARRGSRVHLHSAPLTDDEVGEVAGLPVTAVARTAVDVARTVPFEEAVCLVDAAIQHGMTDPAALAAALGRAARWPGARAARRTIGFADGRSESVGESRSRVAIHRAGLPAPILQWWVLDGTRRVDFGWPAHGVVGEFDGQVKYLGRLAPGPDPGRVVWAEKLREDRIRALGLAVVRWTWAELADFTPVADRLRALGVR